MVAEHGGLVTTMARAGEIFGIGLLTINTRAVRSMIIGQLFDGALFRKYFALTLRNEQKVDNRDFHVNIFTLTYISKRYKEQLIIGELLEFWQPLIISLSTML
jgi:hypothetical protein